ncbi:MAG: MBL fold metallo-hydrolase [Candidatus Kerfeldbacteria bacterium]|nr:MBL fold metallo-hydrolase [Candidatus Kerfeldbacteria bacterium]
MTITHHGHSCVQIEKQGTRILIDPGKFAFDVNGEQPEAFTGLAAILLTHEHIDHTDPEILKRILAVNAGCVIVANASIQKRLKDVNIESSVLSPAQTVTLGTMTIQGVDAPHESLPIPVPECRGFLIDDTVFHPGDSLHPTPIPKGVKVLCAPACAPWMNANQGIEFVDLVKPEIVMPIHTAIFRYPMLIDRIFVAPLQAKGYRVEKETIIV